MNITTSRPEGAFVLLLMQSTFWMIAGLSALPFAFAGERAMAGLGLASLLLALFTCLVGIGVLWRRRWARVWAIGLEAACVIGGLLLLVVPIGANNGPVALMVNVALPVTVIYLLRGKKIRAAFAGSEVMSHVSPELHEANP
jgi:hypothetical protein